MGSDIRVKFVEGIPWPDNSWQMELAARGLGPHNKEWHDREIAERKPTREKAIQRILDALRDESYDVADMEQGEYSSYTRTVLTRRPIKSLKIDFNELETYHLYEDEDLRNRLMQAINSAFCYELGESDENDDNRPVEVLMSKDEELGLLRTFYMHLLNEGYCICGYDSTNEDAPTPYYQASHDTVEILIRRFLGIRPQGVVSGQPLWSDPEMAALHSRHEVFFDAIVGAVQEEFPATSSASLCRIAANVLRWYEKQDEE